MRCLLKECVDILVPVMSQIVNTSISKGVFPDKLKKVIVFPLLKKPSLDHDVMKNYRLVSNIAFKSKVIEREISFRVSFIFLIVTLIRNSSRRMRHLYSTETALLRIKQDILSDTDQKKAIRLVLDLSAAFVTLDHYTLLARFFFLLD